MEKTLGRRLTFAEVVHHKNHDPTDNDPDNLEVMARIDHARHHMLKNPISKPCEVCGTTFTPHQTKRKRDRSCSKKCRSTLISEARSGIKITSELAAKLRALMDTKCSRREIARSLKVARATVDRMLAGNMTVRP